MHHPATNKRNARIRLYDNVHFDSILFSPRTKYSPNWRLLHQILKLKSIPIPFSFPWLVVFPFPWESHGTHGIPFFPILMHIFTSEKNIRQTGGSHYTSVQPSLVVTAQTIITFAEGKKRLYLRPFVFLSCSQGYLEITNFDEFLELCGWPN